MDAPASAFRQTQRLLDDAFDVTASAVSHLYLSFGAHRLRVGVVDVERNKFVALEEYESGKSGTVESAVEMLRELSRQQPILQQRNWAEVRIGIKNQQFTLLPETLFDLNARDEYLRLNAVLDPAQETVCHHVHPRLELVNVFTAPTRLQTWAQEHYQQTSVSFLHQTSALMEGFLHIAERMPRPQLFVYVDKNYVTLVVLENGRLEFCNSFFFATQEDFIYYVLFVLQEQKMNPDQDQVTVWGELMPGSELYNVLRRYLRHVQLGKKLPGVGYSYRFDSLFDHRNFDLFSLHFCD